MPILIEHGHAEFALFGSRRPFGARFLSERKPSKGATSASLKANPLVSPAKRRLNFDDPCPSSSTSRNIFQSQGQVHPASDRSFGTTTTKSSPWFVDEELDKVSKEQIQKWNFDFVRGIPLEGRYKWEALKEAEDTTPKKVHPRSVKVSRKSKKDDGCEFEGDVEFFLAEEIGACSVDDVDMTGGFLLSPNAKSARSKSSKKQLLITDVFRCRKRTSSAMSPPSYVDSLPLAENTRKALRAKRPRLSIF